MESAVFLGYQSALEYLCRERYFDASGTGTWNSDKNLPAIPPAERTVTVRSLPDKLPSDDHIAALLDGPLRGLSTPVHVLVPSKSVCRYNNFHVSHLWTQKLLHGSFQKITKGLFCSSPEFCFIQMARMLSLLELARLANELCGTYALAPCEEDGFRTCRPLTSRVYLKSFITRAQEYHMYWSKQAGLTLRYISNRSASPMETVIALLLALPYRYGGYGIPFPHFNEVYQGIGSPENTRQYRCDLLWKKERVAIEYEGEEFHTGLERIERDADRCNALTSNGLHIVRITKRQLYSNKKFDEIAQQILGLLGKRLRISECNYNWAAFRDTLRAQLLPNQNNPYCNERIGRSGADFLAADHKMELRISKNTRFA